MATASVSLNLNINGLMSASLASSKSFNTTAPDAVSHTYKQLAVADTEEALDLGDISTVEGILFHCIAAGDSTDGITIDPDFDSAYDPNLTLAEGESAYFKPVGTVKVKNATGSEQPTYEAIIFGTR